MQQIFSKCVGRCLVALDDYCMDCAEANTYDVVEERTWHLLVDRVAEWEFQLKDRLGQEMDRWVRGRSRR